MKKNIIIIICIILSSISVKAQYRWEFNYFALELSMNHNFAGAPDTLLNRFVNIGEGNIAVYPAQNIQYTPGYNFGLQFHHDFDNDKIGLVFGVNYSSYGTSALFYSADKAIELKETNRISCLGIPVLLKFGHQIYNNQGYFFVGGQFNLNLKLITSQKLKGNSKTVKKAQDKECYNSFSTPIFVGFNYKLFNMKFSIMPQNFLKKDYEIVIGDKVNKQKIKPYECQPKTLFYINTGFIIPISQWTTNRSYILSKIF
ncbi:MAG: PorT family protein [Bacteroidales bacterium]|nr:PorT family protein [Bacteroidales bacterium]